MTINIDETVLLKGKMLDLANYITTLVKGGIITTNEGREILGLNKMENADKLFVAFTDINQNTINGASDNKTTDEPLSNEPKDSSSNNK
jgi:dsDNA-binding SOS-regulon protein